jgi:hypothetical protein
MCVLSRAQKRCSRTNGTNGCVTANMGGAAGLQGLERHAAQPSTDELYSALVQGCQQRVCVLKVPLSYC